MKDISEERKRQIELELVDIADALIQFTEELGVALEVHTSIIDDNENLKPKKILAGVYFYECKWDKGKKYRALEYGILESNNMKEMNPLNGLLSRELKDWIRVKEEEDTE
jgi:hypothetical protein